MTDATHYHCPGCGTYAPLGKPCQVCEERAASARSAAAADNSARQALLRRPPDDSAPLEIADEPGYACTLCGERPSRPGDVICEECNARVLAEERAEAGDGPAPPTAPPVVLCDRPPAKKRLRDRMASAALRGMLAAGEGWDDPDRLARGAYAVADAMLRARG